MNSQMKEIDDEPIEIIKSDQRKEAYILTLLCMCARIIYARRANESCSI